MDQVGRLLQAEIAALLAYTASVARRMDLGVSEIAALEHLQGAGELTPGQLGGLLSMTSGAVTALVDRLVAGGYVERVPNPRDRRSSLLRLTAAGTEKGMEHLYPLAVEVRGIVAELSDEERAAIGKFMESVTAAIVRQARGDDAQGP
ncbi:MAG: MarR family winged helix-turn-helix transcriptional regulator [Rubrobacter sp.]